MLAYKYEEILGFVLELLPAIHQDKWDRLILRSPWDLIRIKDAGNSIRWWLLAPPNDVRKNVIVKNWLSKKPRAIQGVQIQLEDEGLLEKK